MKKLFLLIFSLTSTIAAMDLSNTLIDLENTPLLPRPEPIFKTIPQIKQMHINAILNTYISMRPQELENFAKKLHRKIYYTDQTYCSKGNTCLPKGMLNGFIKKETDLYDKFVQHAIYKIKKKPHELAHFKHKKEWRMIKQITMEQYAMRSCCKTIFATGTATLILSALFSMIFILLKKLTP